jgi:hypothetical protein
MYQTFLAPSHLAPSAFTASLLREGGDEVDSHGGNYPPRARHLNLDTDALKHQSPPVNVRLPYCIVKVRSVHWEDLGIQ